MKQIKYSTGGVVLRLVLLAFVILFTIELNAQHMLGIISSESAGVNSIMLNPSRMPFSRYYADLNLATGNAFLENNYLYIPGEHYTLSNYMGPAGEFPENPENGRPVWDYYDQTDKNLFENARINGPSMMYVYGDHAFAFHNSGRVITTVKDLPYDLAKYMYEGDGYEPLHGIRFRNYEEFNISSLAWGEIGLSYAYRFLKNGRDRMSFGFSVKRLQAYSGFYLNSYNLDYEIPNNDSLVIYNFDGEVGYSIPIDYESNEYNGRDNFFKGSGYAFNLGVTFQRNLNHAERRNYYHNCEKPYAPYEFRFGISLMDFGRIRFTENARKLEFDNLNTLWDDIQQVQYTDLDSLIDRVGEEFSMELDSLLVAEQLDIALPSTLGLQFDYRVDENFSVNTFLMQDLKIGKARVNAPSQLAVIPGYHNDFLELKLPLSLYDYEKARVGLAATFFNTLTVGTDNIGWLSGMQDFTGMDIYFSIRIGLMKGTCPGENRWRPCPNNEFGD
ncbi:MAG: DUF5723 family protein [Bacteroidales bacterium]|nr:DUF5723 family protein [Bacteroidales bacterium]